MGLACAAWPFAFVCMKSIYLNVYKLGYGSTVVGFLARLVSSFVNEVNNIHGHSSIQPSLHFEDKAN